jgi:hypothetical protein
MKKKYLTFRETIFEAYWQENLGMKKYYSTSTFINLYNKK